MTIAERIEQVENSLYVAYKTYYEAVGPVPVPVGSDLFRLTEAWWAEFEWLIEQEEEK